MALCMLAGSMAMNAQEKKNAPMKDKPSFEEMVQMKADRMAMEMGLDDKTADKFRKEYKDYMDEKAAIMKEGQHVEMMFLADEERCLTCELPTYVELEVTYTEPAVKGDTASTNAQKEVTLETGAIIMAPLFINIGERIRVNTTDRSYGERVK